MTLDAEHLRASLVRAQAAANEHRAVDDAGSCNFDTAVLSFPRMRAATVEQAAEGSGVRLSKIDGAWWRGCYFVFINSSGQAYRRTKMAEAAAASLAADGYDTRMYYQLD